ncbi:MAG: alpha/beta fold hydrolase [Smithellaceae bacterium]
MKLAAQESLLFEREYEEHYLTGETKPRSVGEPFLLHNPDSNRGVLLIHGLMAAPEEVRPWADFLYAHGYTVYGPRLAGHGTSAADLATRNHRDWTDSVNRGHTLLKTCCEQIIVAGFSTGGGLALYQAITKPKAYKAVISVNAPLKFKSLSAVFAEPFDRWNVFLRKKGIECLRRDFVVNHPDNPQINYHRCPVHSIVEVKALMQKVYEMLPSLSMPALIMQADHDPKVEGRSGKKIFDRIASADKTYHDIHFHLHGIVRGDIASHVFARVEAFLSRLVW